MSQDLLKRPYSSGSITVKLYYFSCVQDKPFGNALFCIDKNATRLITLTLIVIIYAKGWSFGGSTDNLLWVCVIFSLLVGHRFQRHSSHQLALSRGPMIMFDLQCTPNVHNITKGRSPGHRPDGRVYDGMPLSTASRMHISRKTLLVTQQITVVTPMSHLVDLGVLWVMSPGRGVAWRPAWVSWLGPLMFSLPGFMPWISYYTHDILWVGLFMHFLPRWFSLIIVGCGTKKMYLQTQELVMIFCGCDHHPCLKLNTGSGISVEHNKPKHSITTCLGWHCPVKLSKGVYLRSVWIYVSKIRIRPISCTFT